MCLNTRRLPVTVLRTVLRRRGHGYNKVRSIHSHNNVRPVHRDLRSTHQDASFRQFSLHQNTSTYSFQNTSRSDFQSQRLSECRVYSSTIFGRRRSYSSNATGQIRVYTSDARQNRFSSSSLGEIRPYSSSAERNIRDVPSDAQQGRQQQFHLLRHRKKSAVLATLLLFMGYQYWQYQASQRRRAAFFDTVGVKVNFKKANVGSNNVERVFYNPSNGCQRIVEIWKGKANKVDAQADAVSNSENRNPSDSTKLSERKSISSFRYLKRCVELSVVFLPALVTLPYYYVTGGVDWLQETPWLDILVGCIEHSGVILIKAAQYASHRRDLVGDLLSDKFYYLREHVPAHRWEETKKILQQDLPQVDFEVFEPFPIASGSIAQVYMAKLKHGELIVDDSKLPHVRDPTKSLKGKCLKGRPGLRPGSAGSSKRIIVDNVVDNDNWVAVKVRHPGVEEEIEIDLTLLHETVQFLAGLSNKLRWLELPVTIDEFKRVLIDQTNMIAEAENLVLFQSFYADYPQLVFPTPYVATRRVLIESYEDAIPVSYFIDSNLKRNESSDNIAIENRDPTTTSGNSLAMSSGTSIKELDDGGMKLLEDGRIKPLEELGDGGIKPLEDEKGSKNREERYVSSVNEELARIGLTTINRMIWFDNFVHADCHAGNIFFRIRDTREELNYERALLKEEKRAVEERWILQKKLSGKGGGPSFEDSVSGALNRGGNPHATSRWTPTIFSHLSTISNLNISLAKNSMERLKFDIRDALVDFTHAAIDDTCWSTYAKTVFKTFNIPEEESYEKGSYDDVDEEAVQTTTFQNQTESLRSLMTDSLSQTKSSVRFFRKKEHRHLEIELIMFDVGMVTCLSEKDRHSLMHLVKHVVLRDANACTKFMRTLCVDGSKRNNSTHHSVQRQEDREALLRRQENMMNFERDMHKLFEGLHRLPIHLIDVGTTVRGMLQIIVNNEMKIEGNFAALLSSLIILEGMAKDLDPTVNLVGTTIPFLLNSGVETFMELEIDNSTSISTSSSPTAPSPNLSDNDNVIIPGTAFGMRGCAMATTATAGGAA